LSPSLPLLPPHPLSTPFPYTTLFRSAIPTGATTPPERRLMAPEADLPAQPEPIGQLTDGLREMFAGYGNRKLALMLSGGADSRTDRKSTRLNSSHVSISYAVFCLKKK